MSRKQASALLFICCLSTHALALPEDRSQTLHVAADKAELNQTTHHGIYIGNVSLDQGSTHLRAAQAITQGNEKNKLIKASAKGDKNKQAHFSTLTSLDKPPLHAYADRIDYYPEQHMIELIGNARVEQGKNSLAAAKVIYDIEKQHVLTPSGKQRRTRIILYPEKKHE